MSSLYTAAHSVHIIFFSIPVRKVWSFVFSLLAFIRCVCLKNVREITKKKRNEVKVAVVAVERVETDSAHLVTRGGEERNSN